MSALVCLLANDDPTGVRFAGWGVGEPLSGADSQATRAPGAPGHALGGEQQWRAVALSATLGWTAEGLNHRLLGAGIRAVDPELGRLISLLRGSWDQRDALGPEERDDLYQELLQWSITAPMGTQPWRATPGGQRRSHGAHYTPAAMARAVTAKTLGPLLQQMQKPGDLAGLRICDPACGSGVFLQEAWALLSAHLKELNTSRGAGPPRSVEAAPRLVGIDRDPLALLLAGLRLEGAPVSLICADALAMGPPEDDGTPRGRWATLCPEASAAGGFDVILGNPPWVAYAGRAAQPLARSRSATFAAHYGSFARYRTLHGLFIEQCSLGLRPRGRMGLVVPTSVADLDGYGPTRQVHDRYAQADAPLMDFGDGAFERVAQPCMALTSTRLASERSSTARVTWPLSSGALDEDAARILLKLEGLPRCPPDLFGERGYQTMGADRTRLHPYPSEAATQRACTPLLTGTEIREFQRMPPRVSLELGRLEGRFRPASQWDEVAVYIRQTARVPIAAPADGTPFRNSVLAGFERPGTNRFLLLAYLNSSPVRWLHFHRFRDARQGMPQLKIGHLRALPCPPSDESPAGQALTRTAKTVAERNAGLTPKERQGIDRLVSEALGLSVEEQRLVAAWARTNAPPKLRGRAQTVSRRSEP